MSFFEEYKPFRNYMRQFALLPSLVDVWNYSINIIEGKALASGYASDLNAFTQGPIDQHLYPWDLDVLAREVVLNAGPRGSHSLKRWNDLAAAVNFIRKLDNAAYSRGGVGSTDVMFELHRIAHRQFPWQKKLGADGFIRALKVFGEEAVNRIVERELGMTAGQYILLGTAVAGHFQKKWGMSTEQEYQVFQISRDASRAFFDRLSCTSQDLRRQTASAQSYDRDWLYAWNPLEATPLIRFDQEYPERVICPIPYYILTRATVGLFYDLIKAADFDNPFGNSFQAYVGEVAKRTCPPPVFSVVVPEPYFVGSKKRHGTDWIVSDKSGHLFIECKTKRLTLNSRIRSDPHALDQDLAILAEAIVQNLRNIKDAITGTSGWINDGLPIFSIVLTLEEWFIFSPRVREMLDTHVNALALKEGISKQDLEMMPCTVASAREFEVAGQVIAQVGIGGLMRKKLAEHTRWWGLLPFLTDKFENEFKNVTWEFHMAELDKLTQGIIRRPK